MDVERDKAIRNQESQQSRGVRETELLQVTVSDIQCVPGCRGDVEMYTCILFCIYEYAETALNCKIAVCFMCSTVSTSLVEWTP